jgi:hypothetical protein
MCTTRSAPMRLLTAAFVCARLETAPAAPRLLRAPGPGGGRPAQRREQEKREKTSVVVSLGPFAERTKGAGADAAVGLPQALRPCSAATYVCAMCAHRWRDSRAYMHAPLLPCLPAREGEREHGGSPWAHPPPRPQNSKIVHPQPQSTIIAWWEPRLNESADRPAHTTPRTLIQPQISV